MFHVELQPDDVRVASFNTFADCLSFAALCELRGESWVTSLRVYSDRWAPGVEVGTLVEELREAEWCRDQYDLC